MQLEALKKRLRDSGLKLTPQREMLLRTLLEAGKPMTAQEIHDHIRPQQPQISFDTVYRNLSLLSAHGLVNKINLKVKFNTRFELAREHSHHLVCLKCGASFPLPYCPFETRAREVAAESNFRVVDHAFEVYGYCAACDSV